ncbi:LacI family DNA-binding transcriptional regulator [Novosphingobium resinovorum]|uniref:LacI family transcriptional regulator n=1 Tax=Novosphingobium resinovorum TaxID=158500 RepID=A0A031JYQ7_9SPHN|nr:MULTISPECIES: LacI family DNA-binding transcriptional regulator [Sphingomonadaceae]AOR78971.1 sugar-binding protein [Novosphingobium resinovorum]EJU13669.1 LacI family transcriptional regulator [Sphingomonas sp. LH128]EZP82841.1 LacI family transcriptional regulator [Novosphingobium resinovorum]MBF7014514.1 LacI family DNA-binding transcriptional regulator [Novosphingobium sp. HR1a]WJM25006.1 LacI family DNA-binding transcriptional regulator [Novosphingobium resinovorum]
MEIEKEAITSLDVARRAGVSQSAVSRAFTPGASIAADKRERIIAAAEELGYRPNPLARSLLRGRSNIVGVGVGYLTNPFFTQTLQLLSDALDGAGLRLMLFPAQGSTRPEPSIHEILHYRIDALVLLSVSPSSTLTEQCRRAQVPVIHYNRTTPAQDASCVVGDNETGARAIAAHLLAGRHRRFAFMAGTADSSTNAQREAGFTEYLAERGAPAPIREDGAFDFDTAMAATRRLLLRKDRPEAIFCANDTMALAAITVARHEFGLDVGREISIAGYDDVPMAAWPGFSLTSYSQPAAFMVAETLRLILSLRTDADRHEQVVAQGSLVVRGSTRPVGA